MFANTNMCSLLLFKNIVTYPSIPNYLFEIPSFHSSLDKFILSEAVDFDINVNVIWTLTFPSSKVVSCNYSS